MHNQFWQFIQDKLHRQEPVMLIVVTGVRGSSPGKKGFKMAVGSHGEKYGTIGGGPMEFSLEKLALKSLLTDAPKAFTKRLIHSADAGEQASGLICAGEQHHAFIKLGQADAPVIAEIVSTLSGGQSGYLTIHATGLQFAPALKGKQEADRENAPASEWIYEEVLHPQPVLFVFGGGHVSIPVTKVAKVLGFRVEVYDDRQGLPTLENNNDADHKQIISYRDAAAQVKVPDNAFVCIMTVSHASDQLILEQLLPLSLKYLGMIGSRKKVDAIFGNLRIKGFEETALAKVDAPMGVAIESETPAEIAVSIMAEVIRRKNKEK